MYLVFSNTACICSSCGPINLKWTSSFFPLQQERREKDSHPLHSCRCCLIIILYLFFQLVFHFLHEERERGVHELSKRVEREWETDSKSGIRFLSLFSHIKWIKRRWLSLQPSFQWKEMSVYASLKYYWRRKRSNSSWRSTSCFWCLLFPDNHNNHEGKITNNQTAMSQWLIHKHSSDRSSFRIKTKQYMSQTLSFWTTSLSTSHNIMSV